MKMGWNIIVLFVIVLIVAFGSNYIMTGNVVGGPEMAIEGYGGPSAEDSACLRSCVVDNGRAEDVCLIECGVAPKTEPADEGEGCMQQCVARGCDDERDFNCQRLNVAVCEDECGMKGDAPDESEMSEEQRCISDCVAAEDPSVICGNSKEGETGDALCRRCASDCAHLYSGPCLNDDQISEKEEACNTCGHCYGEPVEGPSGQGWDCIVDIECADASSEFGDEPGEGPGVVESVGDAVGGFFKGIGEFFGGLF